MNYLLVGKLVNTHALKGEVRIISSFEYKELIFKPEFNLYIGNEKEKLTIETYRKHKNFDMVKFIEYSDILEVNKYKGQDVYVLKEDLDLCNKMLDSDLIGLECFYNNKSIGKIKEIINNNNYKIISINEVLIPYNENFIESIDIKNKKIIFKNVEGLIDEN